MLRTTSAALFLSSIGFLPGGSAVQAQESTTRGFNAGIHLQGSSLQPANGDRSNAGGGGILVGYGLNRTIELFLQLDGAEFDVQDTEVDGEWRMGHGDLGVRFHFSNSLRSWVPYLQTALSFRVVSVEDAEVDQQTVTGRVGIFGGALMLGGGIMFYFNQTLAADLQLAWTGGEFTEAKVGDVTFTLSEPYEATTSRLNIGISWWP